MYREAALGSRWHSPFARVQADGLGTAEHWDMGLGLEAFTTSLHLMLKLISAIRPQGSASGGVWPGIPVLTETVSLEIPTINML